MDTSRDVKNILDTQTKISYNMSNEMSNQTPDPLSNQPDPVIFYDREGRKTGWMKKAEIREKDLVLVYNQHGPTRTMTAEEQARMFREMDTESGYPKHIADSMMRSGILALR